MIKVAAPAMACKVIDWAIQAHGAAGVSGDFMLAYHYAQSVGNASALAQRALTGADFTVYLGNLVYNPTLLKRTVAAYHAANRQTRVER